MQWTETPPTEPGYYWYRYARGQQTCIRRLDVYSGGRVMEGPFSQPPQVGQWYGPLVPPDDEPDCNLSGPLNDGFFGDRYLEER